MQPKHHSTARVHASASVLAHNDNSCKHCTAAWGHTILCPLLNRNVAEAQSAVAGKLNVADEHELKALGVIW